MVQTGVPQNAGPTLSVKRNITSSERHTLKSKAQKINHNWGLLAIILLTKHIKNIMFALVKKE